MKVGSGYVNFFANTDSINKTRRETRGEKFAAYRLVFSKLLSINKKEAKTVNKNFTEEEIKRCLVHSQGNGS